MKLDTIMKKHENRWKNKKKIEKIRFYPDFIPIYPDFPHSGSDFPKFLQYFEIQ